MEGRRGRGLTEQPEEALLSPQNIRENKNTEYPKTYRLLIDINGNRRFKNDI